MRPRWGREVLSAPSPGAKAPGVTHMGLLAEPFLPELSTQIKFISPKLDLEVRKVMSISETPLQQTMATPLRNLW